MVPETGHSGVLLQKHVVEVEIADVKDMLNAKRLAFDFLQLLFNALDHTL